MSGKVMVSFPNQSLETYVDKGTTVGAACEQVGLHLDYVCGGRGTCGKCSVEVGEYGERKRVLACQEKVYSEIKVFLTETSLVKKAHILTSGGLKHMDFNPAIKKVYAQNQVLPLGGSAWEYMMDRLNIDIKSPSLSLLQKFSGFQLDKKSDGYTLVLWKDQLIDIEEGDTTSEACGFAIDIGTTTVAAYLYNLSTGENIGVYSALNGQVDAGGDVITRIVASIDNPTGLRNLQSKITDTINELITRAVEEHHIQRKHIYSLALCGNSAMQHLFLGLPPNNLGRAPFSSVIKGDVVAKAKELDLNINPIGIIHFLPLIGGFVGADTTAVLLSLLDEDTDKMRLVIDLGTNGELVLGNKDKMLAASTAAGPALEGAGIKFGMRGTNGAIERVNLSNGKVELEVIMDEKPLGLCGSGLIDVIAEMLKVGIIDERGRLLTKKAFLGKCKPEYADLAENLERIDNLNVFILVKDDESQNGSKIYISQKDVRAVQLAKGAIYTGCMLLLRDYGLNGKQLDEILIAGAFGNYIDVAKGQYIGLLPSFEGVPIRSIGNAAGAGVQRFLLNGELQDKTLPMVENICHVELASNPNFHEEYFTNVNFPKY